VTGTYGAVLIGPSGDWFYTLDDLDADTNALVQGAVETDVFTYTVADAQGATSSTTLTISINGSNDFPTFLPIGNTGDVTEDGQSTASGHLVGFDPDHGAILTYGLQFQPTNGATADYLFRIDEFTLTRMRPGLDAAPVQIFNDEFDDGLAPPNGVFPPPDNTQAYGIPTTGTFLENDGRTAVMDGSLAQPFFNFGVPQITTGHNALITTSRDPISVAPTRGLRPTFDFDATARFDLILPEFAGQAYGISLSDARPGFGGDDHIQLLVRRDTDGVVRVVMREGDAIANSITPIESMPLDSVAAGDQIVLHLTHDPDPAFPERTGVI